MRIGADRFRDTTTVNEKRDGLDFFYSERNNAIRDGRFLVWVGARKVMTQRQFPALFSVLIGFIRVKSSEQLISSDTKSNTANYKFTYSVELVPICKDDLVCVPLAQARSWGNIS